MSSDLSDLWNWFADTQCRGYSPLYDRVCRQVAGSDDVLAIVRDAPPEAHLPTVLLAAVHHLILSGLEHPLADVYAGNSDQDPGPLFVDVCLAHGEAIGELLGTRHTNTNEVGRSALLGPALTEIASRTGQPIGLVDVGCSAGLNLVCDRYLLDYGTAGTTGPPDAQVRLTCEVTGGAPPIAPRLPPIVARYGLDRDPVDLEDDDAVRWQLACVWPDTGRLARTRASLELARDAELHITRGDAVDALPGLLAGVPRGCLPVVVTTWALAYLSPDRRAEFVEALQVAAAGRPIAWVSGEGAGVVSVLGAVTAPRDDLGTETSVLGLVTFDGDAHEAEVLAFVHPHGRSLDWRL
ncbi:MAG TPA: DUF2332 domain-containing protein [Acidimicrobiales bacterium]|nr:DUF2332 domain-containing protein [Acidimicrobiales bacterium]